MYEVVLYDKAKKSLHKLELKIQKRILDVLERIRIRPFHFIKRKQGTPYDILRIGDYRAILDIRQDKEIIFVIEVGHRKKIYD